LGGGSDVGPVRGGHARVGSLTRSAGPCAAHSRAATTPSPLLGEALEENVEDVIAALKDGIRLADRKAAAKATGDWIALVYGRQLQKPEELRDEH
jgi:hypothetical protein